MDMHFRLHPHLQRYGCVFFVIIVSVSVILPRYQFMAFGKDSPVNVVDEKE